MEQGRAAARGGPEPVAVRASTCDRRWVSRPNSITSPITHPCHAGKPRRNPCGPKLFSDASDASDTSDGLDARDPDGVGDAVEIGDAEDTSDLGETTDTEVPGSPLALVLAQEASGWTISNSEILVAFGAVHADGRITLSWDVTVPTTREATLVA